MLNGLEPVSTLVDGIKGVTSLISGLFSRKAGVAFFILVFGAIVSKLLFS